MSTLDLLYLLQWPQISGHWAFVYLFLKGSWTIFLTFSKNCWCLFETINWRGRRHCPQKEPIVPVCRNLESVPEAVFLSSMIGLLKANIQIAIRFPLGPVLVEMLWRWGQILGPFYHLLFAPLHLFIGIPLPHYSSLHNLPLWRKAFPSLIFVQI